ncbi:MAG: UDP-N-acetylmuramoyl-L-alanine--D-glutamate ligase, partial [Candidatus Omnitrophica bacterium]|nr:UDP-N-acetylmuramoyl-L-alanine--D-glutamate ligase [Candidatus Omnitrophota bacterium]
ITIVGLARSGVACAQLLSKLGAKVSVTEHQDNQMIRQNASKLDLDNISIELGRHSEEFIRGRDMVIVSPGVPLSALPLVWAEQLRIPLLSEIEVGWLLCPATVIAVTGSNGKTTVTTLISKVLEAAGKKAFLCGNIGEPFCAKVDAMEQGDFVCLEVSSFQLETTRDFKPKISVILNFSQNHLDRYRTMQDYLEAKKRIFMNQDDSDYVVLNYSDPTLRRLKDQIKAKVVYFSEDGQLNPNQAAVLAVSLIIGVDREVCLRVFREFKGIEHRLEFVAEIDNVSFINDSKATTVDSTIWALSNISRPVILIAGGRDKGSDYQAILDLARKKVRYLILIGEAKGKIYSALKGALTIKEADTLQEAVKFAFYKANPGDCVLFSPMCSSFDMFTDYEQRGKLFKQAVYELKNRI